MTEEKKGISRRGFLKGAATVAAAGGLITAAPVISKAGAKERQYEKYFVSYLGTGGGAPGGLAQQYFKSNWPDPESSTNLIELFKLIKPGEAQGTGGVIGGSGEMSEEMKKIIFGMGNGEYSSTVRYYDPSSSKGFVSWPYRPTNRHYYSYMSLDPDHPDEIDATFEFWMGDSDEAEQYIKTRPGVWYNPPGVQHGPLMFREINKPVLWLVCCAIPSESQSACVGQVPRGFNKQTLVKQQIIGERKYANCFTDVNPKDVILPPSLKGKVVPVLFYDFYSNSGSVRTINIQIIKEGDIGFGIGESTGEGMYNFWEWPHKHYVNENIFLANIDPTKEDLGGEVELWMGDGTEAEKYIINKRTLVIIPANTYHFPMYVRKLNSPMALETVMGLFLCLFNGISPTNSLSKPF